MLLENSTFQLNHDIYFKRVFLFNKYTFRVASLYFFA